MKIITEQMEKAGVHRIIAVGGLGVLDDEEGNVILQKPGYKKEFIAVGEEHFKAYSYLKDSSLNWTFVCCPDLVDADPTGIFHTAANRIPHPFLGYINTGDLALFMLKEVVKNEFSRSRVGISN
jgi:uncharacterized protein